MLETVKFGARALGNRSILANPSNNQIIKKINEQIKNRDFWLPLTTVLKDHHKNYLLNQKILIQNLWQLPWIQL